LLKGIPVSVSSCVVQDFWIEEVMSVQRARTASEATGSQVQFPEGQVYCGMAQGREGSVLKMEL
jgi:hypothetical protein